MIYHYDDKIVHGLFVYNFREYLLNNIFIALFPSIKDFIYDYNNGLSLMMITLQMLDVLWSWESLPIHRFQVDDLVGSFPSWFELSLC